jgi:geranylgeranyl pyrophosphate synthase
LFKKGVLVMEIRIGKVTHYFHNIGVAVILLDDALNAGDEIHIQGKHTDFRQKVTSMQVEHTSITRAEKGQDIGLKVIQNVHEGDEVYRIT